jgi:hypothetical protein
MGGKHRRGGDTVPPVDVDLDSDLAADLLAADLDDSELDGTELDGRELDGTELLAGEPGEAGDPASAEAAPADDVAADVLPGGLPPTARRAVRAERAQRARRVRLVAAVVVAVLVVAAAAWALLGSHGTSKPPATPVVSSRVQQTLLLQIVDSTNQTIEGVLLAHTQTAPGTGFGGLVPNTLLVNAPSLGPVVFAATSTAAGAGVGTGPAALSDAIGVTVDGGWRLSQAGLVALVDAVGGLDVTVDEDIQQPTAGGSILLMRAGPQHLSGGQAAAYATYLDVGSPEQQRLARLSTVMQALLAKLPVDPRTVSNLVAALADTSTSTLPSTRLGGFLTLLHGDAVGGRLTFDNVPTHPLDSGGTIPTVVVDSTALTAWVKADFAGSVPTTAQAGPVRVLVQNGVGTPGLDDKARLRLAAAGLTYVAGGNATTFNNPTSTVLIADGTDASRVQGAIVAKALGLPASDIKITQLGQNLADVIVVIGDDFKP